MHRVVLRTKIIAILFSFLNLCSCSQEIIVPPSNTPPSARKQMPSISTSEKTTFSRQAREISDLLDDYKYNAAEKLLNTYIPQYPNDAGLYCQYVRYIVAYYDVTTSPFIANPIRTDDRYRISFLVQDASQTAIEFDEKANPYLADMILKGIYYQLEQHAIKGTGFVTAEYVHSYVNDYLDSALGHPATFDTVWYAIELDAEVGRRWASSFERLAPKFAKAGKPVSAMYVGNMAGDLSTGAQGNLDFEKATQAFRQAIEEGKSDPELVGNTTSLYLKIFKEEVKTASEQKDPSYFGLLNALRDRGHSLEQFR